MVLVILVALQALQRHFVGLHSFEADDFALVAAAFHVRLARSVAGFTGLRMGGFRLPMRSFINALPCCFMAGQALIGSDELG